MSSTNTRESGFSLIELMVAITLGLLLSIGIISLFGSTSNTNKVQDALANLQENGRYAVVHVDDDLRMLGGLFCSNKAGSPTGTGDTLAWPGRAPGVLAASLPLPDSGNAKSFPATGSSTSNATTFYALSPRWFVQGYECATGTCVPSVASEIPTTGVANLKRVPKTDVLTVRYQRGNGWPLTAASCISGGSLTISPQSGDDTLNFAAGNLALVTDCVNPNILPISAVAGNTLTIGATLAGGASPFCGANAASDTRVFNFSADFVTVSYYLAFRDDNNPDASANSAAAKRQIPVLIRRENGIEQEIVQGVDRLDFLYGVQDGNGVTRYLDAGQVNNNLGGAITCTPAPNGIATLEPGCLWRSVRSVEIHMLLDTVNNVASLDTTSMSYTYSQDTPKTTTISSPTTLLPSGIQAGRMMRREFVSLVSVRNYNP
ncbi:MAG: PilW family protein [Dokdonella sp.]